MSHYIDTLLNPVKRVGEHQVVKTPIALANQVLDGFPTDIWKDKGKKWLNPISKNGVFERCIYERLMTGLAAEIPNDDERREWIISEMIWSFSPHESAELMVRLNYLSYAWNDKSDFYALRGNVQTMNFLKVKIKDGTVMVKDKDGIEKYVKIDCVVGNPPYQDNSKANDPKNIYPDFVLKAISADPEYLSMVIPARWMMGSGKGIAKFLATMIGSKKLSRITLEKDSLQWFNDVSIKGGIMHFLYDRKHNSHNVIINGVNIDLTGEDCILDDIIGLSVKAKVLSKCDRTFDKVMLGSCPFEIRSTHKNWSTDTADSYTCHNSGRGKSAKTSLISKAMVKKNVEYVGKYKMCCACACGYGSDGINKPFVIGPGHVVSQSYLVMAYSDSEQECVNAATFFDTHLAQYLISLLKNTQNVAKRVFKYLPYLDFTRSYTDRDLYTMFDLSKEEIAHIEKTTKDFPIFRGKKPSVKKVKAKFKEMELADIAQ